MALSQERKQQLAQQLADKRSTLGDRGFSQYVSKLETAIPQRQAIQQQTVVDSVSPREETPGFLGKVSRFTGVDALGRGIAASLNKGKEQELTAASMKQTQEVQNNLLKAIKDARAKGDERAVANLENTLQRSIDDSQSFAQGAVNRADLGVSNRDVIGSAIRTAGTIASAGTYSGTGAVTGQLSRVTAPALTSATSVGRGILQGAGAGIKTGAASGSIFGGVSGLATGIEDDKGVLGTALEVAKQGAIGGVVGGAVGGVVGSVGGGFQARSNRKAELRALLQQSDNLDDAISKPLANDFELDLRQNKPLSTTAPGVKTKTGTVPTKSTAGYKVEAGQVVPDKPAQKLLKQGVSDTDVAIMQSFSPEDTAAARKMVDVAQEVSESGIPTKRPQEIAGQAFMQRANDVEKLNNTAGRQIDDIARSQLAGVKVNAASATDDFFNQLDRAGVDVDTLRLAKTQDDIARAFADSDFDGIPTVQKTIKNVLNRADGGLNGADMDGLQLHRLKRFIDNQVTYGKNAEGLTGDAERLLKGLRTGIDDVLDNQFPQYNSVNTQYKDTIEALDEMRRLIGRDFLGSKNIADLRAGEVMNRLLGNASAKPLSAVQNLENTARKYGTTYNDSIIKQITFADLLDDIYETVPTRGLKGSVAGGVEQGAGFLNRMRQSGFLSASIDEAADVAKTGFGITPEARQKAVEEFLGLATK